MEPIRAEFTYTAEDLSEGYRYGIKLRRRTLRSRQVKKGLFGWALFVVLTVVLASLVHRKPSPARGATLPSGNAPASEFSELVLPVIPWLVLFLCIYAFFRYAQRNIGKSLLENNPTLQIQKEILFHDEGIDYGDATVRTRYQWAIVADWEEADHCLLISLPGPAGLAIPKRGFRDASQVAELKEVLRARANRPAGGFPVGPAGPPWQLCWLR